MSQRGGGDLTTLVENAALDHLPSNLLSRGGTPEHYPKHTAGPNTASATSTLGLMALALREVADTLALVLPNLQGTLFAQQLTLPHRPCSVVNSLPVVSETATRLITSPSGKLWPSAVPVEKKPRPPPQLLGAGPKSLCGA